MLDVAIIFTMFLYIYSTQLTITYFLVSFGAFRIIDTFSLIRARREYHPSGREKKFVHAWIAMNIAEMLYTAGLLIVAIQFAFSPLMLLGMYIALRLATRIIASLHYKEVYFS